MAETQKFTIDKNNFLVYQTINELGECVLETPVHCDEFKDPIELKNPELSQYYYMKLNWADAHEDYLALDGRDWGLHEVNDSGSDVIYPSVLPKSIEGSVTGKLRSGYTMTHFSLEEDRNLYLKTTWQGKDTYEKFSYNFALVDNYQHNHFRSPSLSYDDIVIVNDREQFNTSWDFDSNNYVREEYKEYKIINEPCLDTETGRIYHKLQFYDGYGPVTISYKNENDNSYLDIENNISFVTFVPTKNPEGLYDHGEPKLEWILCIFCRGEALSNNWSEVNVEDKPKRIKMEWRPLRRPSGSKIVYTDEQYKDFLNRKNPIIPSDEYVDPNDRIPASYSNTKTVEVKCFNIDYNGDITDENLKGIMYDNRNSKYNEFSVQYYTPYSSEDVYCIERDYYYNVVKTDTETSYVITQNSFILMDLEGYCLYCPELIKQYGIAFIKSDWVYRDETGALCVNVSENELTTLYDWWGENTTYPKGDVVKGRIFSTKFLKLDVSNQQLNTINGYTYTVEKCSEELLYTFYEDYWFDPSSIDTKSQLSYEKWKPVIDNRTCKKEKPNLCTYGINNGWTDDIVDTKLNKTEDGNGFYEIVIWKKPKINFYDETNKTIYSHFERYRIEVDSISDDKDLGREYKEIVYWVKPDNNIYLCTINGLHFDRLTNWQNYSSDFNNNVLIPNDLKPEETYIKKEAVYFITYTINLDLYPKEQNPALPSTWTGYLNYRKGIFQKNKVYIEDAIRDSVNSREEYLEDQIKTGVMKTPAEWYGTNENLIDDNPEPQEWFWLNTLSNWCKYEVEAADKTTVTLKVWNGLGVWDSVTDIMGRYFEGDNYALIKNYLYDFNFFRQGPGYPHNYLYWVPAYVPIKIGADSPEDFVDRLHPVDGQMRYGTLILLKDNKSLLYKSKMNKDYAKVYFNQEYNTYSRQYYPDPSNEQATIRGVDKDDLRPYIVGSETQPVPCVTRLANGNLSILYDFVVQTNGRKHGILRNIVNTVENVSEELYEEQSTATYEDATELNRKCKTIFGDGADKTIAKDWKRYIITDNTEEINSNVKYMSEETLYGSPSLTNIRVGKGMSNISITAPRPNPTTNNKNIEDYIERWNK